MVTSSSRNAASAAATAEEDGASAAAAGAAPLAKDALLSAIPPVDRQVMTYATYCAKQSYTESLAAAQQVSQRLA
jgi:hypothetical protein